jgi:hypothetical protein
MPPSWLLEKVWTVAGLDVQTPNKPDIMFEISEAAASDFDFK